MSTKTSMICSKYLPIVVRGLAGPQARIQILMRGLKRRQTSQLNSGGSIKNGFPTLPIYLDEQSGQLGPARNLEVRRPISGSAIEVLEGAPGNAVLARSSGRRSPLYPKQAEAETRPRGGEHFWKSTARPRR